MSTHLLGNLELGQLLLHPALQLLALELLSRLENDGNANILAVHVVGDSEADGLGDGRVAGQDVVELNWANLFAALVDELLDAARDDNVAVLVLLALVARAEEAALGIRRGVGSVVVEVSLGDVLATDANLALLTLSELVTSVVEDAHVDALAEADGAGLALRGREGVGGHLVGGLGHGVGLEDGRLVGLLELVEDGGRQRGRAGADEANGGQRAGRRVLEEDLVNGGHGGVPVGLMGDEVSPELGGRELVRDDHGAAAG